MSLTVIATESTRSIGVGRAGARGQQRRQRDAGGQDQRIKRERQAQPDHGRHPAWLARWSPSRRPQA